MSHNKALFLDRDWVINIGAEVWKYITTIEDFTFAPWAQEIIKEVTDALIPIFVITNQQCIWKWVVTYEQVSLLHSYMINELEKKWWKIEKIMVCPHLTSDACTCRKPQPWMILSVLAEYSELDPSKCLFVWDSSSDIEAWIKAWVQTINIPKDGILSYSEEILSFFEEK